MFVYLNGKLVRSDRENNILTDLPLGYDAIVVFRRDSYKAPGKGFRTIHEFRNLNQIHINYAFSFDSRKKVAFESDIVHRGGGWRYCDEIECIFITPSTKTYSDYCIAKFQKYEPISDRFSDHYQSAYNYGDKMLENENDELLKSVLSKLNIIDQGTLRDRFADAYMAGCNRL